MRIRAFPFGPEVAAFIDAHDRIFVVEQNRDAQMRTLLMEGDTESYNRVMRGSKDSRGDAFDALTVMMENCPEGPYRHVIAGAASSLSKMSLNQRGGVLTTAMEHTSFLDMPQPSSVPSTGFLSIPQQWAVQ